MWCDSSHHLLKYLFGICLCSMLCFCSSVVTPLHSLCLQAFAFRPLLFSLSLCCKGCASLWCPFTAILMSNFFVSHQKISPAKPSLFCHKTISLVSSIRHSGNVNVFYNEQVAYIGRWIENSTSAEGTG